MDQFLTLTAASSSSSPSLDDSSMQRSIRLVDDKPNGKSMHDIVVDFGTGRTNTNTNGGTGSRTTGDIKHQSHTKISDLCAARCWKYTIFGLLSITVIVAAYTIAFILHEDAFDLSSILIIVLIILIILVALSFLAYDRSMQRVHTTIQRKAAKSTEFVASMFPADMHRRLFDASITELQIPDSLLKMEDKVKSPERIRALVKPNVKARRNSSIGMTATRLEDGTYKSKPIAELYPETTIMLADLVGFTAWSSARDPTQVFILLETIFIAFDEIAVERNVFKVETVGDCYVAVAGVPDPRDDHAVVMAQFANACLERFASLVRKLEVKLGPGTADLGMRIGLHSGPITGGILRGERSRFQLFGDTINTAARMESNSMKGRIQLSEQTADLIVAAKMEHWLLKRDDKIEAKGKGMLQTYWLTMKAKLVPISSFPMEYESNSTASAAAMHENCTGRLSTQHSKLVDYNTECLLGLLKQILARRAISRDFNEISLEGLAANNKQNVKSVMDDLSESIQLPAFHAGIERSKPMDADTVYVDPQVVTQLRGLLQEICQHYNSSNYFHNFEHATHVAMSVLKLISRIVSPLESLSKQFGSERRLNASKLYDHTFGLTSDPLTLFACAFSALIQSVDHPGVSNMVLVNENGELAKKYNNRSIAEQNSIDVAWNLLMADQYTDLRAAIFSSSTEQDHFRQIVIHSVMATDMLDPKLKEMRNQQWKQTFGGNNVPSRRNMCRDIDNRKATIVIEHLMQTSSIAHTMQHWHIYRKWSEKLYREMLVAFLIGRTEYDPSVDWFEREIQFFDFTVIPLARKLKECGVFGVSGHEYLTYAMNNRKAWESTGKEIVAETSERCKAEIMVEIMKLMKSNDNPETHQQLQCAISDQFGPDSLLLTSLWSKDNYQSILGLLDEPPAENKAEDDDGDDDDEFDIMAPLSPVSSKRNRTIAI